VLRLEVVEVEPVLGEQEQPVVADLNFVYTEQIVDYSVSTVV